MGTTSPAVSVIIPTFNRIANRRLLEEHLKAHKRHSQENVAVLGYTTWAPTLSVTPLMHYVTDVGRAFFLPMAVSKMGRCSIVTFFWGGRSSCKQ